MSLSKEDRLLLNCSKVILEEENIAEIADLLQDHLDWDYIIKSSIRHGVAPLLRNSIKQVVPHTGMESQIPKGALEQLEELYQTSSYRNQKLYQTIGEIVRELDQAGVQVMGLKDVQLAKGVYPDPALRPMGDIDLLIHPQDYEVAADCMFRLGFIREPFDRIPYILKYAWGHHFRRPDDNIYVDMQWNVMQIEWDVYKEGSFDFEIERMWKNAEKIAVGDYHILVPKLEDMLFHLCIHLDGHHFSELILLCDIYELIKQNEFTIDWQYFTQIVNKYEAESFTYYSLRLINHLFQVTIPPKILLAIKPAYFKASFIENLFGNLTRLHYELDDMQETVLADPTIIQNLEIIIRQQAASAMKVFQEIDQVVRNFKISGASYACLLGSPSERLLADSSLSAFNDFNLLVLADEVPVIRKALLMAGFESTMGSNAEILKKNNVFQSRDPVLQQNPTQLIIESIETKVIEVLLTPVGQKNSRQVAIKLLRAKLAKQRKNVGKFVVRLNIIPLTPEQILMCLCHRIGQNTNRRLFELVNAIDFFEIHLSLQDWENAEALSRQFGVHASFDTGSSLVKELLAIESTKSKSNSVKSVSAHIFEWARIDPESSGSITRLKRPFNLLRSFLSIETGKEKISYIIRLCKPYNSNAPVLVAVLFDIAASVLQLFKKKHPPVLAYWTGSVSSKNAKKK